MTTSTKITTRANETSSVRDIKRSLNLFTIAPPKLHETDVGNISKPSFDEPNPRSLLEVFRVKTVICRCQGKSTE